MTAASKLSVAIFDNNPAALVLMKGLVHATLRFIKLDPADIVLTESTDPQEAEDLAASGSFDLVITDLMWPVAGETEWRHGLSVAEFAKVANRQTVVVVVTSVADEEQNFRTTAKQRRADLAYTWEEAFGSGKATTAGEIAERLKPRMSWAVPVIASVTRQTVGLVGLDTVAYSEEGDAVQEAVVRSFLGFMSESWDALNSTQIRPVFVFTGDGLFLGLVGTGGERLALDLAIEARRRLNQLAGYKTRLAVHFGPVNVATLTNGGQQLLGHTVNWLFRAVDAAETNGLVVTEEYFATVLQAGRAGVAGVIFNRRETVAKHGRTLVVRDVTFT